MKKQGKPTQKTPRTPALTPQQIEQGLERLKARTGFEMAQDDPMRSAAAELELSMDRLYAHLDGPSTESPEKAP